ADGLWIDISGVAHLFGGEERLLDDITQRLASFGVEARAGLGDTLGAAHGLARFGCPAGAAWVLAPEGAVRDALAPLPVEALRLDGASVLLLKRLGLRRIAQLYDIPRDSLARRFRSKDAASAVLLRLDTALGHVNEPRRPMQQPPVLSAIRAFTDPLITSQGLEAAVADLADELSAALAAKDTGAKAVRLALYRADGTCAETGAAMSMPSRDSAHIMRLLKEKLSAIDAGFGVDLLRLDALRVERHAIRQDAFEAQRARAGPVALIDQLSNRLGASAVTVLLPRASHIPERAEARVAALKGARLKAPASASLTYEPPWPYGRGARRPPFLLARPERIEVLAGVPDGPPARFTWRRVERRVARAEGPERIAPEWWRHLGLSCDQKRPRPRDYYTIEDHDGAAYWVFRHGLYGGGDEDGDDQDDDGHTLPIWFLHGMFA
ncbi:MAG: DNA polymerase Y family protein, partial [Hyphomicrobium sp.]